MGRAIHDDGTWAWASDMLLAGGTLRRKHWVQGCTIRMLGEEADPIGMVCCVYVLKDGIPNKQFHLCESHLRATDWEVYP